MLRDLRDAGRPVDELLNDRAFSYKRPERWADPLRDLGIAQVFDLHPNDMGPRDHEGMRMVAGVPHCPAMPNRLVDITRPTNLSVPPLKKNATVDEIARHDLAARQLAKFEEKISERQIYAFVRIVAKAPEKAKDQGKTRWICPAQAGKVRCDNCSLSAELPPDLPEVENPPALETAPQCCKQRLGDDPWRRHGQARPGAPPGSSPEWIAADSPRTHRRRLLRQVPTNPQHRQRAPGLVPCCGHGAVKTSTTVACAVTATSIAVPRPRAPRTA